MLDEIIDKLKENGITNIAKAKLYFFAGAYGYFYGEREKIQSNPKDVARVELFDKYDYRISKIVLNSIYQSQKNNLDEKMNKYRLFEEYANVGVKKLYEIFKKSEDIEEFIETIELKISETLEKLGISLKEEEENE
ncbi:hypothetical protein [Thermosipho melanesiensis]|uniref:Uncharacterized protein n=2 Tax=Thermosipho melanesiensis TaxID=46541 RepID=A6LNN1_THEM4|nr:hypothetical protein [Thermosipho melanesiensis]ABR31532.1 hypothetical protein Tmel_1690 [Thermosipho melanesiensis BI429]APT74571.1 hypothetical protein BW47_08935 [Thermosipho melanesiensis]